IAGDEDGGRAGRGPGRAEGANQVVDLTLELGRVDEAVDPQGAEEVTDPLPDGPLRNLLPQCERRREWTPVRAAQHGGEDVDHHRERIALVATVIAVGAEWKERAAVDHPLRLVGDASLVVDRPPERNLSRRAVWRSR